MAHHDSPQQYFVNNRYHVSVDSLSLNWIIQSQKSYSTSSFYMYLFQGRTINSVRVGGCGRDNSASYLWQNRADSRFAPNHWETSLQSNAVSHWLGANLESALRKLSAIWSSPNNLGTRLSTELKFTAHKKFCVYYFPRVCSCYKNKH